MSFGELRRRLSFLLHRKRFDDDLAEEMRLHRELRAEKFRAAGSGTKDAASAARRRFGDESRILEESRTLWSGAWLEALIQDARYALRQFRKATGFTAIVLATLMLGIGVNTAVFSIINTVILKPLPYRDPARLMYLGERIKKNNEYMTFSYPDYLDCRAAQHSFTGMAAFRFGGGNLTAPGEPAFISSFMVSSGFFSVLGVSPILGREFLPSEDEPDGRPVAILSHAEWQKRWGGNPGAVGSTLVLNGVSYTVVGVLPAGFRFLADRALYTPIGQYTTVEMQDRQMHPGIRAIARLAPGISPGKAQAELHLIGDQLALKYPDTNQGHTFGLQPLKEKIIGDTTGTLLRLAGAVGLVLLIACANVANLFLARSAARSRELAIRASIGAGRGRIIRQLLTESVLLALVGGIGGFLLAALGTSAALAHIPGDLPRIDEIAPDLRVLLFTLLASTLTGILFGLLPALQSGAHLETALRQGSRGTPRGLRRTQSSLVIAETALALVLLMGAGLMVRTMSSLWSVNPGFDPRNLLDMEVALSPEATKTPAAMRTAWQHIYERVNAVPGVEASAISALVPMKGDDDSVGYWTTGPRPLQAGMPQAMLYIPSPGYLKTMGIPLLQGRFFIDHDKLGSEPVVVIDQRMAERAFPGRNPVGARLNLQVIGPVRVVGVVGSVKHWSLDDDPKTAMEAVYFPFAQIPDRFLPETINGMDLLVRTSVSPKSVVQAVKEGVMGPGHDQPLRSLETMEQIIGDSLSRRRLMLILLSVFAGVAVLLAAVGIYGVLSYSATQRVPEIGIRLALGARPAQVLQLVLREGMLLVLAGVVIGTAAALPLMRLIASLLYRVHPADPLTLAAVALALAAVALAAIYLPARRASRVDPLHALRQE